jgi:acetyl-CoA synthetase
MKHQIKQYADYQRIYQESISNPEKFWEEIAQEFHWQKKWDTVLNWNFTEPKIEWFKNGKLNITENCLDRHLLDKSEQTAMIWEPNNSEEVAKSLTYAQLHQQVASMAQVLRQMGAKKGDRICIYMPMIPELAIIVLACARIGAVHSVVFAGFSANAIADRIQDAQCAFAITTDGAYRGSKELGLKAIMDEALIHCPSIQKVLVYQRTSCAVNLKPGRDFWWHDLFDEAVSNPQPNLQAAEVMDAEDLLFILYTSGSTGKPKGVVHTCGGYMVYAWYTFINVFQYQPGEIHFCTADIGWVTGHSYIVYGPLLAGATTLLFEGIPTYPDAGRFWDIVLKHQVNIFYTAPTAIRSLMAAGLNYLEGKDLSSLKKLGSVGEPINEEAWHWYDDYIGKNNAPIVDTWWQTETGGILISSFAGVTPTKPSFATLPLPGIQPVLVDDKGNELLGNEVSGNLCVRFPWPGMLRTTYGDHERCRINYFSTYPGLYFTGDGCLRDENGFYRITGRVDDVLNVSGHRIGTAELENAINEHPLVVESAVVGFPHDIKGLGIYAFVICQPMPEAESVCRKEIEAVVSKIIGAIAKPDKIQFVSGLPKTRSGKIMRRILRKIAEGELQQLGDTTTLLDPSVVEQIIQGRL